MELAKEWLPGVIREQDGFPEPGRLGEVLASSFSKLDDRILGHLQSEPQAALGSADSDEPPPLCRTATVVDVQGLDSDWNCTLSSGCVLCLTIVCGSTLHVANLGDCRALLCNDGKLQELTVDHRPDVGGEVARLEELGVSVSNDGYMHGRLAVSRALGGLVSERDAKCRGLICTPDVSTVEVTSDTEFLLLACDGIFERMTNLEAMQTVRRKLRLSPDPKQAAEALVKYASKTGSADNLSAIVVLFKQPAVEPGRTAPRLFLGRGRGLPLPEPVAEAGGG